MLSVKFVSNCPLKGTHVQECVPVLHIAQGLVQASSVPLRLQLPGKGACSLFLVPTDHSLLPACDGWGQCWAGSPACAPVQEHCRFTAPAPTLAQLGTSTFRSRLASAVPPGAETRHRRHGSDPLPRLLGPLPCAGLQEGTCVWVCSTAVPIACTRLLPHDPSSPQ